MPTFGVDCTEAGKARAMEVLEKYRLPEDKGKEAALIRIMEFADSEAIRGQHPQFEPLLRKADETITVLIKQINGIVAGITNEVSELKTQINTAYADRDKETLRAYQLESISAEKEKRYTDEIESLKKEIKNYQKEAENAKTLAEETSKHNSVLLSQISEMKDRIVKAEEIESQNQILKRVNADIEKNLLTANIQLQQEQIISENKEKAYTEIKTRLEKEIQECKAEYKEMQKEFEKYKDESKKAESSLLEKMHKMEIEYLTQIHNS